MEKYLIKYSAYVIKSDSIQICKEFLCGPADNIIINVLFNVTTNLAKTEQEGDAYLELNLPQDPSLCLQDE